MYRTVRFERRLCGESFPVKRFLEERKELVRRSNTMREAHQTKDYYSGGGLLPIRPPSFPAQHRYPATATHRRRGYIRD